MTWPRWLAGSMLLAVSGQVPPPAPAPQQTPPVFRSGIDLVRLDVSVLDADRRPVRDLAAADFTILVDGVPQPIVAFSPVVIPPPEQPTAPWMREVAPDVRSNALGEPRLFVIIMDDAMTPADPFMVEMAKTIARRVVDELGPGDLAAVLFTMARRSSQDLTSDRAKLLDAIAHFNIGFAGGSDIVQGPGSVGISRPAPSAPLAEQVEVLGKVFTLSGKAVTSVKQDVTLRLVPAAEDTHYEVLSRLDLKPGRYVLRVSARSATLDRTGSVYADVTVPDFTKPALALSGVVISAAPAPRAAPTDALASLLPIVPTTTREFTASHAASAFVRIYQGGKRALAPVELFVRLTNGRDQVVSVRQEDLPPARFGAARAADHTYALPLARLEPGPYLLTITALAGKAAPVRADVRFTVW